MGKKLVLTSTNQIKTYINMLVYGPAGVGKTYLMSTLPGPLVISAEGGMLTLKAFDIPMFSITSREELNEIHDWLSKSKEADKYESICVDSLSEIAEVLLSEEKAVPTTNGGVRDPRQAYGAMADLMNITVRGFRDLPKHTYFSCKVRKLEDELTGKINYLPSVPGQMFLDSLPYLFDELFILKFGVVNKVKNVRHLQTVGDHQWVAKDRSGKLMPQEAPHLGKIMNKILAPSVQPAGAPAKSTTGD
jgi:hypothetical protein